MALNDSVSYVLDRHDCIDHVGDTWDRWAIDHGVMQLCGTSVLGTSVWLHIHDATVAELYRLLFARVRSGNLIVVPYDGSSSAVRREMQLQLRPLPGGFVECISSVVFEEEGFREVAAGSDRPSGSDSLLVCSWCGRVRVKESWREIDEAVVLLRLFFQPTSAAISHGLCPRCAEGFGL